MGVFNNKSTCHNTKKRVVDLSSSQKASPIVQHIILMR